MLYVFSWNSPYLLQKEKKKWKHAFWEKYGVEQVTHITDISSTSSDFLLESLIQRGLFSEKRLVIIEGFPYASDARFSWAAELENILVENLKNIDIETLVVFISENPDKRKAWYKALKKVAELKEFSLKWDFELQSELQKLYPNTIENSALERLIFLKWWNFEKCVSEIEKLLISPLSGEGKIQKQHIESFVMPEFEESIFAFIDTILTKNKQKIFSELQNLLDNSNLYALYQSIIANLRVFLYIELLRHQKKSQNKTSDILKLWNRSFLINKKHASSFSEISKLYKDLLDFDRNMKTGKLLSSDEIHLQAELERIFLKFVG